jgi:hypothetical protein
MIARRIAALCRHAAMAIGIAVSALGAAALAQDHPAVTPEQIQKLMDRLEQQDLQLKNQSREIEALRDELNKLRAETEPPPKHTEYRTEEGHDSLLTNYDNPRIKLEVAAQINQAVNVANDGHTTRAYFVDNDTSNSRLRIAGVGNFKEGPEVGTTFEMAFSPNPSSDVSQDAQTVSDFVQVRRAELWARDLRYGRVMFGRGSQAANNAAAFDLSLVSGPIMYSGISDIVGGLQFTDRNGLSGVHVNQAFFNFDGTRANRIRYDTPMFGPAQVSLSAGSSERYDAAVTFGGDYDHWSGIDIGDFTTLGAIAVFNPRVTNVHQRIAGSWSLLHNPTGLNLTASSGFDNVKSGPTPLNAYGKLGWNASLLPVGATGFGVDYTWTENVSAPDDKGWGVGAAAVQDLDDYGIQLYTQFRVYSVDRAEGPSFNNIYLGTMGTRVRF